MTMTIYWFLHVLGAFYGAALGDQVVDIWYGDYGREVEPVDKDQLIKSKRDARLRGEHIVA